MGRLGCLGDDFDDFKRSHEALVRSLDLEKKLRLVRDRYIRCALSRVYQATLRYY